MAFQYLGLRAKLEHVDVTEEEVNRQLVRLQQQSQRRTPVFDRPSQNGDELVLDYAALRTESSSRAARRKSRRSCLAAAHSSPALKSSCWAKTPATM